MCPTKVLVWDRCPSALSEILTGAQVLCQVRKILQDTEVCCIRLVASHLLLFSRRGFSCLYMRRSRSTSNYQNRYLCSFPIHFIII